MKCCIFHRPVKGRKHSHNLDARLSYQQQLLLDNQTAELPLKWMKQFLLPAVPSTESKSLRRRDNGFDFSLSCNDLAHSRFPLSAIEYLHLKLLQREASQATSGSPPVVNWTSWTWKHYSSWLTSEPRTSFQQNQRSGAKFRSATFSSVTPHQSGLKFL